MGQSVDVTGALTVAGRMSAGTGDFTGLVEAESLESRTGIDTDTVTASGTVTAGTVGVTGAVNADSATFGALQSGTVNASVVDATTVTAEQAGASSLRTTGSIAATSAGISRLTVGSCSGC